MKRHFSVEVGFAGYINGYETVDVYVDPEQEFYWNEDDLEESLTIFIQDPNNGIAGDLLAEDGVEEIDESEYEVTYNFATFIGFDEIYTVYADDEDEAIDRAFEEACNDLTVESYEEIFDTVNSSTRLRSRRITASIDPSAPDWLTKELTESYGWRGGSWRNNRNSRIADKFNLNTAKFLNHSTPNCYPIYLFGRVVYFPGINDDEQIVVNGRFRTLGKIAKSSLMDNADDVVFVDLDQAPPVNRNSYQDPRFFGDRDREKGYAGQGRTQSGRWFTNKGRDKSGYQIPDPKEKLMAFYKDPSNLRKLADKVEDVYNQLVDAKNRVLSLDVPNTRPQRDSDYGYIESQDAENYSQALSYLGSAVRAYNRMLNYIPGDEADEYATYSRRFKVSYLLDCIKEVRTNIGYLDKCLGKMGQ